MIYETSESEMALAADEAEIAALAAAVLRLHCDTCNGWAHWRVTSSETGRIAITCSQHLVSTCRGKATVGSPAVVEVLRRWSDDR